MNERQNLVAPCGIDCGICELYICRDDENLKNYLISKGIPESVMPCDGCRNIDGKCPIMQDTCKTYQCVLEKDVEFCSECHDFPCEYLSPAADMSDKLPHNLKVYNLMTIMRDGIKQFVSESQLIKSKYYQGKMHLGEGPKLED